MALSNSSVNTSNHNRRRSDSGYHHAKDKKFQHYETILTLFKATDQTNIDNHIAMESDQLSIIKEEIAQVPLGGIAASYISDSPPPIIESSVSINGTDLCLKNIEKRNFTDHEVMTIYRKSRSDDTDRNQVMREFLEIKTEDNVNTETVHYNSRLISGVLKNMAAKRNTLIAQVSNAMLVSPILEATPKKTLKMPWGKKSHG